MGIEKLTTIHPEPEGYPEFVRFFSTNYDEGKVAIWYSDGDLCAIIEDNVALGVVAEDVAKVMVDALNGANIKVNYG